MSGSFWFVVAILIFGVIAYNNPGQSLAAMFAIIFIATGFWFIIRGFSD